MSFDKTQVGQDPASAARASQLITGATDYKLLDASAGDATVSTAADLTYWGNCRGISADTGGKVKIDYLDSNGATVTEVLNVPGDNAIVPIRNVVKLYWYTTGTTVGTAKCFSSADSEITNAIKLRR
jgi:hypothetical protein